MMIEFDPDKIIETAKCRIDETGFYCVESAEYDLLIGVGESEGEAWKVFFEHLHDAFESAQKGTLAGFTSVAAKALGKKGRSVNSASQAFASRENGKKGGRPRKQAV